ncbi:hypothetical protein E6O51_14450 [Pseudothauera rhizosphaerae]|uniref:Uncharacterized protein n=2 Tax=Pseudothauera rhizosphaerae TaxID=2565932 RepID=A0A4S4ALM3_9RHOO|nr:hypothetical protein E6O51_14450 [Pseudothauera rhizosphaerae]
MAVVFTKTAKGQEEINGRAGALTPRQRRVLIFVDGKRTVEELRGMLQSDDLQHTLGLLEESGYIEVGAVIDAQGKAGAAAGPLPSITAFRKLPAAGDSLRLKQARNFMANTVSAFVGRVGASSLLERIEQAADHGELRALFDEWYHSLVGSREGRREAEALRAKLLEVI